MKYLTLLSVLLVLGLAHAMAAPLQFEEISLLVRMRESDALILKTASERRLIRALTSPQEKSLKALGASDQLLESLRSADLRLSDDDAAALETLLQEKKVVAVAARSGVAPTVAVASAVPSGAPVYESVVDAGAGSGVTLVIDKLVIVSPGPLPGPYYALVEAKAGRAVASHHIPDQKYADGISTSNVEIPLNLRLKNVQMYSWVPVTLQLDAIEKEAVSYRAFKKHTSRIEVRPGPMDEVFVPYINGNEQFVYRLIWHTES